MIERIRTRAVWLAIGLAFGGSAFAVAGSTNVGSVDKKPTVASIENENENETEEVETTAADENETTEVEATDEESTGERKLNHGYYVSQAAHCEDVADTENDVTFTAPDDCDENGKAHGAYVSSVAKSGAGKAPKTGGDEEEGS